MRGASPQRTYYQPVGGTLVEPVVQYRIPLGGAVTGSKWIVSDANLDGDVDVAMIRAGRVVLRSLDGRIFWASSARDLRRIEATADLDGDGSLEIFASSASEGVVALDGRTGQQVWAVRPLANQTLGSVIALDVEGDGFRELYLAECGTSSAFLGGGRIFGFRNGYDAVSELSLNLEAHGDYWRCTGHSAGDLDGDGVTEIITLGHDRVHAYSGVSGEPLVTSPQLEPFPYARGDISVGDVDSDGRDEVVVASDNSFSSFSEARRLILLEVLGDALRIRTSRVFDAVGGVHGFPAQTVASLTGVGQEVVTSHYDVTSGRWETLVFSGAGSGFDAPLAVIPDSRVIGYSEVREDGTQDLVVMATEGERVPVFGRVRALSLAIDGDITEVWSEEGASVLQERSGFDQRRLVNIESEEGRRPVCLLDRDSDGRGETLSVAGLEVSRSFVDGVYGQAAMRVPSVWGGGVLVSVSDGGIERLDSLLAVQNDTSPRDGQPDLRETSFLPSQVLVMGGADGPTLLSNAAANTLVAVRSNRPSASGALPVRWRSSQNVARSEVALFLPGAEGMAAYRSRGSDNVLRLHLVRAASGTGLFDFEIGVSANQLGYHDLMPLRREGREPLVAFGIRDRGLNNVEYRALDIQAGFESELEVGRDLGGSGDRPASAVDWTGDGVDDFFVVQRRVAVAASGQDGARIVRQAVDDFGGVLGFVDLTPAPGLEVFHQATRQPRLLQPPAWTEVWAEERYDGGYLNAAFAPLREGGLAVANARNGDASLTVRRGSDGEILATPYFAGGRVFGTPEEAEEAGELGAPIAGVIGVNDLVGDGAGTFVATTEDGHVYALRADDGVLHWAALLRGIAGPPIAADIQGDGSSEVLVPVADGFIAVVASAGLEAPAWVVDLTAAEPSFDPGSDVDDVFATGRLAGGWASVEGADGYEYRILREDDLVVTEYRDVGLNTSFLRDDITLELGRSYRVGVRAYSLGEDDRPVSVDAVSDGVLVSDNEPPEVELEATPRLFWRDRAGAAEVTTLSATLRDSVGLASVSMSIVDDSGILRLLADVPIGGTYQEFVQVWDGLDDAGEELPGGVYEARVSVTDQTGLTASAAVPVVLCAGDFAAVGECAAAFPSVLALRAEPPVIAPGIQGAPAYTDLILEVLDATAVVRYRLTVFDSSGAAVVTLADEPVVGSPSQLVERWLGTSPSGILVDAGVYEARAEVISEVGLRSEASATVTVCRDDQDSPAACVDALMPWQARGGCECAVSAGNSSSSPSSHHLVCLLGLILWFQRRRFRTK